METIETSGDLLDHLEIFTVDRSGHRRQILTLPLLHSAANANTYQAEPHSSTHTASGEAGAVLIWDAAEAENEKAIQAARLAGTPPPEEDRHIDSLIL